MVENLEFRLDSVVYFNAVNMPVQTVLGNVSAADLGRTLTHEHFSLDFNLFYRAPPAHLVPFLDTEDIRLDTVGFLRQYPYGSRYNVQFGDAATHASVLRDVQLYREWGGGTIVENSSHGLQRNLKFALEVSRETGVHVVVGTGHYVHGVQSISSLALSVEQMSELYRNEITVGCEVEGEKNRVRCGFIGEVGSGWPIHEFEKRSIQATGTVQAELKCPVSFHPGRESVAPGEIVRIYLEAGGNADKCIMSHLDRTIFDIDELLEFAKTGVYCQFDLFGTECSFYQLNPVTDMPSDAQRIDKIIELCKAGFLDRVLMSHDVHTKHRLIGFGGHGYGHIINNVLPRMQLKGMTQEEIDQISITNPAKWLEYNY